jgi:hypothetical protein
LHVYWEKSFANIRKKKAEWKTILPVIENQSFILIQPLFQGLLQRVLR